MRALDLPCPKCKAEPGKQCISDDKRVMRYHHGKRCPLQNGGQKCQ